MMSTEETWQCAHPASSPNKIYERTEPAYLRPHILTKPHWDQLHPPQDKAQRWDQSSEEDELPLHLHIVLLISRIDTRPGDIPPSEASEGVRRGRGKWDRRKSWSSHRSPWLQRTWLALFVSGNRFVTAENTHVLLSPYTPSAKLNLLTEINKCLI